VVELPHGVALLLSRELIVFALHQVGEGHIRLDG
jgi:hypothetical protein